MRLYCSEMVQDVSFHPLELCGRIVGQLSRDRKNPLLYQAEAAYLAGQLAGIHGEKYVLGQEEFAVRYDGVRLDDGTAEDFLGLLTGAEVAVILPDGRVFLEACIQPTLSPSDPGFSQWLKEQGGCRVYEAWFAYNKGHAGDGLRLFGEAGDAGNLFAIEACARIHYGRGEEAEAVEWLEKGKGDSIDLTRIMAWLCYHSRRGLQDRAYQCFRAYAKVTEVGSIVIGDHAAQFMCGYMCETKKDLEAALYWYGLVKGKNRALAQVQLAGLYERGEGVPVDHKKAAELRHLAEEAMSGWRKEWKGLPPDETCYRMDWQKYGFWL